MYGYFYPENGKRFLASMRFDTIQEATEWFADHVGPWKAIKEKGNNEAAFLEPSVGHIIVVREIR